MDESRIHERIAQQRHDIPEGFHARMDARVQQVIAQKPARRRVHRLQLAAALCLLISAGALALQRSGLLDFRVSYMRESYSMLTLLPDGRAQRRYQLTYTPAAQAQPLRLQLPDGQVLDVSPTKAN
jgi:hypothetical protein